MSRALISHNPDLQQLRDEGYDVRVQAGYLVMRGVPFVNASKEVKLGSLVTKLQLSRDRTEVPTEHVILFAGEHPCDKDGVELARIKHASNRQVLDDGLVVDHSFSSKPAGGYQNYYEKMTTYANILWEPAHALDPTVTLKTFPVNEAAESDPASDLVLSVQRVGRNDPFLSPAAVRMISGQLAKTARQAPAPGVLTPRKLENLKLLASGRSNKEVAKSLAISVKTVNAHRTNTMRKLELRTYSDLVHFSVRHKIIEI